MFNILALWGRNVNINHWFIVYICFSTYHILGPGSRGVLTGGWEMNGKEMKLIDDVLKENRKLKNTQRKFVGAIKRLTDENEYLADEIIKKDLEVEKLETELQMLRKKLCATV